MKKRPAWTFSAQRRDRQNDETDPSAYMPKPSLESIQQDGQAREVLELMDMIGRKCISDYADSNAAEIVINETDGTSRRKILGGLAAAKLQYKTPEKDQITIEPNSLHSFLDDRIEAVKIATNALFAYSTLCDVLGKADKSKTNQAVISGRS